MRSLRITQVQVNTSSEIDVSFTDNLTSNLIPDNITITADTIGVPSSIVLKLKVNKNVLRLTCQPLTPLATYFIELHNLSQYPFISVNGDAKIQEDGVSNKFLITGPLESDNPVRNYFESYLNQNIYNLDDKNTIVSKYIDSLSINLARALHDIGQVKNENYLSFTVTDEQKTRSNGPFDRLNEESAYEIIRVGQGPSSSNASLTMNFDEFGSDPITLQKVSATENLKINSENINGFFNINNLILNLSNKPVTKINNIIFYLATTSPTYIYDIERLGYQILDSRYDQEFAFDYALLSDNQIKLNDKLLEDPNFSLEHILQIVVEYEYKNLGRIINTTTVNVVTTKNSTREVLPPIVNVFNLNHAPIVDSSGNSIIVGGVTFTDPNNISGTAHPAFITEIPFRLNGLPLYPGQYSIDYSTGTVYVYGNDLTNDGTGPYPPVASYNYKFTYKSDQDYVFDSDLMDLVALPNGNLLDNAGTVSFQYEEVLIPNVDYVANLHQEALGERINNNLLALNSIRVQHSPITNVFKIYNETSGEIYTLDRWNDNKILFRYNTPPRLDQILHEKTSFNNVVNELLFVNTTLVNSNALSVFKILLSNNTIISATEDSLATAFNTSLVFSDHNIFVNERWFNSQSSETENINKLSNYGEYTVDYKNGIIYCAVQNPDVFSIGTVSYKNNIIVSQFPHLISVDDIYYQISLLNPKNKKFTFTSFEDTSVIPSSLDMADEMFLNNDISAAYQIKDTNIGAFVSGIFVPEVSNQVKFVRSLYEYDDLNNSLNPINFALACSSNEFEIVVDTLTKQSYESVQFDGSNYYVEINENIPYLSPNITYSFSIVRTSDSAQLWDSAGTIVPGTTLKLVLSGINSPNIGELVNVTYSFTINNLSRVVVDYNKGDMYIDYTYLADEIIVSYEYGDNVIDFRQSIKLAPGGVYYVSYKVGALRDALLRNFGTLINLPELTNFDIDFERERYRDAITAALTSFLQGPTVSAIKNIGKTISHIEPELTEDVFENWSLGNSLLTPESITTSGEFQFVPAKYDQGLVINDPSQTITFPASSNIRLEEGTFENWISPMWNGIDNDAQLTFHILKDGYAIDPSQIFIGTTEYHPELDESGKFTLSKLTDFVGQPNKNKDGVFIYYDLDASGTFLRWYFEVLDGYVSPTSSNYKIRINSTGNFYDTKSIHLPKPSNISMFTGTNNLTLNITGGNSLDEGITFVSDVEHYLLDVGEEKNRNRLSIFKDISGYFNFRVYDKDGVFYNVTADVSSWRAGDLHHVAASWKLNNFSGRDEMHLFIDGFEVPNVFRTGQNFSPYLHEKFKTVSTEELIGLTNRDIVGSTDLQITAGSAVVSSSINFSAHNIFSGDILYIEEAGFSTSGYTIVAVDGQNLILSTAMPISLVNGRFSVNKTSFTIQSNIDIAPNIAISTVSAVLGDSDINGIIGTNQVTSSNVNFGTFEIKPGYLIRIDDPALETFYVILQVSNNTLTINDNLPINIVNGTFYVYPPTETEIPGTRAVEPAYSISNDADFNNILTVFNDVSANDLIFVKTLGLNHKRIKREYYSWSDDVENILKTQLPPPISLDEVNITKIILPPTLINSSNAILSGGIYTSNNLTTFQTTNSQSGRTISITLSGTNVDFSTPVQVTINGIVGVSTVSETITFNDYGTLDFSNLYLQVNYVNIIVKPINVNKTAVTLTLKEKYPLTHVEYGVYGPQIRFSYVINLGYSLRQVDVDKLRDENNIFSGKDVGNYLIISAPSSVAGFYLITGLSDDRKTLTVSPTNAATSLPLPSFTGGQYQILNVSDYRSGLQNGYFNFEVNDLPGEEYYLNSGFYELEYYTYTSIKFDNFHVPVHLGSDFQGEKQLNGVIDQMKIYSVMLTDTRIGESIPSNQRSITKDFNSLKALTKDSNTLMLVNFDQLPLINEADFYITPSSIKKHFQSSLVVNENFGNSLAILNDPILVSNDGILDTKKEGTIEFWINPLFDTANDPNDRYYFDAFGAIVEETVSVDNVSVKLTAPADRILSVKLKNGDPKIDYFAGGRLEIDTQHAIVEESVSLTDSSVFTSHPILQVISVKILGDATSIDYFANGTIGTDMKTIYLGKVLPSSSLPLIITYQSTENDNKNINTQIIRLNKKLPYQKSHVIVDYIPKGLQGDRISIFKDTSGYMNFSITASGNDFIVRAPTRWSKNTWHRVKASYKINNSGFNNEMRLFLDGYQYSDVLFGEHVFFGSFPVISGSVFIGDGYSLIGNINFKDTINNFYIGSKYDTTAPMFGLIDNLRISNISRPIYAPYGEPLDVNYSSNLEMVFPVTPDLFTTYLLNYDSLSEKNTDFVSLQNRNTGLFDFSVNIIDSLDIVSGSSVKVKETLEKLIKTLKPANSKVLITYTK